MIGDFFPRRFWLISPGFSEPGEFGNANLLHLFQIALQAMQAVSTNTIDSRHGLLRRGMRLSLIVIIWNVIEAVVAVTAGMIASSVALISFGIDSSVEVLSAVVVFWRLRAETQDGGIERAEVHERRAATITGGLLLLLAIYILFDAGRRLLGYGEEAGTSVAGIVLTSVSLVVMPLVGWAKLRTADALDSPAMRADSYETIACAWFSLTALVGLGLNAVLGWSWADPLAALLILPLITREGLEAFSSCEEGA